MRVRQEIQRTCKGAVLCGTEFRPLPIEQVLNAAEVYIRKFTAYSILFFFNTVCIGEYTRSAPAVSLAVDNRFARDRVVPS